MAPALSPEMAPNLRASLTIFKVGFAGEAASGFTALLTGGTDLPFHGYLVLLAPVFTALGIVFLWIGQHEWSELHVSRVRHAGRIFVLSLASIGLVAAPLLYIFATATSEPPLWLSVEFGVAAAFVFGLTFVTYALVAAHLVGPIGEAAIVVGLAWACIVSALI